MTEWLTQVLKGVLSVYIYAALVVSILTCGVDSLALFTELPLSSLDKKRSVMLCHRKTQRYCAYV